MSSHKFTHSIFTPNGRIVEEVKMGFEIPKIGQSKEKEHFQETCRHRKLIVLLVLINQKLTCKVNDQKAEIYS